MQDFFTDVKNAASSVSSSLPTSVADPLHNFFASSFDTSAATDRKGGKQSTFAAPAVKDVSLLLLTGGCGVWLGWHGRAWRSRQRCTAYTRREERRRNPLWLLPAPRATFSSAPLFCRGVALREWVAACVGHRWLPAVLWTPPLLRHCAVVHAAESAEAQLAALAQRDAVRWGTRVLTRLHPPQAGSGSRSSAAGTTGSVSATTGQEERVQGALTRSVTTALHSRVTKSLSGAVEWEVLPSHSVDVFTCARPAEDTASELEKRADAAPSLEQENSTVNLTGERVTTNTTAAAMPPPLVSPLPFLSPPLLQRLTTPLRVLPRHNFALLYDPCARLSLWCGYHLTSETADRARHQHRCLAVYADRSLERAARRTPAEVRARAYDRGHLAPHASVAATAQSAMEAALLTNMHLQHRDLNRGPWRWLEAATRAYVRMPYDAAIDGPSPSRTATAAVGCAEGKSRAKRTREVRKGGGVLLARLMAKATPFASVKDAVRVSRRRGRGFGGGVGQAECGRHLCVNVGPLYYKQPPRAAAAASETIQASASLATGRRRKRQHPHDTSKRLSISQPIMRRATKARLQKDGLFIPDAFFLSLWDANTHHHVHLVLPNTPATGEMAALTQALAAATVAAAAPAVTKSTSARKVSRRAAKGAGRTRSARKRVPISATSTAGARGGAAAAAAASTQENMNSLDAAVEDALAAFTVTTDRLGELVAESAVELRMRWATTQPDLSAALSHADKGIRSQASHLDVLALRTPLRLFPVYHERWMWQTRWHRLAHAVSPKLLFLKKRSETVTVCQ